MGIRLEDLSAAAQRQVVDKLCRGQVERVEKRNKYHSEKTQRANIKFDSKKEARRFEELLLMEQAGQIRGLRLQQDFTLQEAYTTPEGYRIRAIRYRADFSYYRPTAPDVTGEVYWLRVVEDVKSRPTRTKDYVMKRKMMQDRLGITIKEM